MSKTFLDGCHKYGWLLTLIGMLLSVAFMTGEMHSTIAELKDAQKASEQFFNQRIDSLERRIDALQRP